MKRWLALLLIAAVLLASGCTAARQDQLYLYGEFHANDELLQRELALWKDYYAGIRFLHANRSCCRAM